MKQKTWLGAVLLVALVFGAYHNSFQGPFIFDDVDSIPDNTTIRSWRTMFFPPSGSGITVSGRPVLNASFALNWHLTGEEVTGVHVTNTLIHLLAALVLWALIRQTLEQCWPPEKKAEAAATGLFAAALWAVHPIQTESVTYMVQRAESLVGLFYLLTLYAFLRATKTGSRFWHVVMVAACLLGAGTKEVMVTVPLITAIFDRIVISGSFAEAWRRHRWLHLSLWLAMIPLVVLVLLGGGRGGSVGVSGAVGWWEYACTQAVAIVRYIQLSIAPTSLTLDYGTWIESNAVVVVPCAILGVSGLIATVFLFHQRKRSALLGAWFFIILAPSSSVIPVVTQTAAEHRMYLPLAAVMVAFVLALRRWLPRASGFVLTFLVLGAAMATVYRNEIYRTAKSIWRDTVAKSPQNSRALNNLGVLYLLEDNDPATALPYLERAHTLAPHYPEANNNLGQALVKLGRHEEGLALTRRSLQLAPANKRLHAGYGAALMDAGEHEEAVKHFRIALNAAPHSSSTHYNLGNALLKLGRLDEAEQHFRFTLQKEPDDLDVLNNYGTLLRRMGRPQEAIPLFTHAIAVAPDSSKAHNNLGVAFAAIGRSEEAVLHLSKALRLEPNSIETRSNLAGALVQAGQFEQAITETEAVVRARPDADLFNNLGALYGQTGRLPEAESAFREALRLNPDHPGARENLAKLRSYLQEQGTR